MPTGQPPSPQLARPLERRKGTTSKGSPLPVDYTGMVEQVFATNFSDSLEKLAKDLGINPAPHFLAEGEIYADEIVVRVSLVQEGSLSATTSLASSDFDPRASSPKAEDLLSVCVDAIGQVFQGLFELQGNILTAGLAELEGLPIEWTQIEIEKRKIFVKVDKTNPLLDQAADDWLAKNDPQFASQAKQEAEQEDLETEKLFVLPPKAGKKPLH